MIDSLRRPFYPGMRQAERSQTAIERDILVPCVRKDQPTTKLLYMERLKSIASPWSHLEVDKNVSHLFDMVEITRI